MSRGKPIEAFYPENQGPVLHGIPIEVFARKNYNLPQETPMPQQDKGKRKETPLEIEDDPTENDEDDDEHESDRNPEDTQEDINDNDGEETEEDDDESSYNSGDTDEDEEEEEEEEENEENNDAKPLGEPETVHHWQIWDQLVLHANGNGASSYIHPPRRGEDSRDVTAFKSSQVLWGPERPDRPPVLSLWMPREPRTPPKYKPGELRFRGRIVLDWEGKPVRAFRNLPLTISSNVHGFRIEAWMRQDMRIHYRDIAARMFTKKGLHGKQPVIGTKSLSSRTLDFRYRAGCVPWTSTRKTAETARAWMDGLRTTAQRRDNLTTDTDLTDAQIEEYLARNHHGQWKTHAIPHTQIPGTEMHSDWAPRSASTSAKSLLTGSRRSSQGATQIQEGSRPSTSAGPTRNIAPFYTATGGAAIARQPGSDVQGGMFQQDSGQGLGGYTNPYTPIAVNQQQTYNFYPVNQYVLPHKPQQGYHTHPVHQHIDCDQSQQHYNTNQVAQHVSFNQPQQGYSTYPAGQYVPSNQLVQDPNDSRNDRPATIAEQQALQMALEVTVADLRRLIKGQEPIPAPFHASYHEQREHYQAQLRRLWVQAGYNMQEPILRGLEGWTGGIQNWRSAREMNVGRLF